MTSTELPEKMPLMAEIHLSLGTSVGNIHQELDILEQKMNHLNPQPVANDNGPHGVPPRPEGVVASFQETAASFKFLAERLASLNRRLAEVF